MKKIIILLFLIFSWTFIFAIRVQQSTLSNNALLIILSGDEVIKAKNMAGAYSLGVDAAIRALKITGLPSSITGKVAEIGVFEVLSKKYAHDIYKAAKNTRSGSVSLKYHNVNIDGVKRLWKAVDNSPADKLMPGGKATQETLGKLNEAVNMLAEIEFQ